MCYDGFGKEFVTPLLQNIDRNSKSISLLSTFKNNVILTMHLLSRDKSVNLMMLLPGII